MAANRNKTIIIIISKFDFSNLGLGPWIKFIKDGMDCISLSDTLL